MKLIVFLLGIGVGQRQKRPTWRELLKIMNSRENTEDEGIGARGYENTLIPFFLVNIYGVSEIQIHFFGQ